jgi:nucleoid-associated protein YgaU
MVSPDLEAPARVTRVIAAKSPSGSLRYCVPAILILSFAAIGAAQCCAQSQQDQDQGQNQDQVQAQKDQSVAEAARQERARKQSQQKKAKHVYTAEDLKREHILTTEDRAQLEARKNQPAPPANTQKPQDAADGTAVNQDADAASPSANSTNAPLGDVARRLRKEKESQELQRTAQFPLPFANAPVLASPKPPAQPLLPPVTVDPPTVVQPAPRVVVPLRPFVKRSPFERPRILPSPPIAAAPRAPASLPPTARVIPAPRPARVAPSLSTSRKLMIVTVKPGDSLWKFAASRLGDGHRWQELLALNGGLRNPDLIQVGTQMVLPASVAPPSAPTKYTVQHGDTLWSIAQTRLHHGSSWSCIARANPDLRDANLIHEGQVLLLPSSCSP